MFIFLQLQDEVIISDAERLKMTQANVKLVSFNNFVVTSKFLVNCTKCPSKVLMHEIFKNLKLFSAH